MDKDSVPYTVYSLAGYWCYVYCTEDRRVIAPLMLNELRAPIGIIAYSTKDRVAKRVETERLLEAKFPLPGGYSVMAHILGTSLPISTYLTAAMSMLRNAYAISGMTGIKDVVENAFRELLVFIDPRIPSVDSSEFDVYLQSDSIRRLSCLDEVDLNSVIEWHQDNPINPSKGS